MYFVERGLKQVEKSLESFNYRLSSVADKELHVDSCYVGGMDGPGRFVFGSAGG